MFFVCDIAYCEILKKNRSVLAPATISASFRASFSALSFLLSDFLLKFFEDINTRGTSNRIRTYVWVFPLEYSAKLSI